MSQLIALRVLFIHGSIDVIVGRITVDKSIQEKGIEGKPPVCWRWVKCVVCPFAGVFEGVYSRLVLIKIVTDELWVESQARNKGDEKQLQQDTVLHCG